MRHCARIAALAICIGGLAGCGSGSSHQNTSTTTATLTVNPSPPPQGGRFFASDSVFNQALSANAVVDPSSPARIGWLMNEMAAHGVWVNTSSYSIPVYRVPANQPTVKVVLSDDNKVPMDPNEDPNNPVDKLQRAFDAVPIPPNASPAPGTDGALVVYQPSMDKMWEMWEFGKNSDGTLRFRWGGAMANVSTNKGYYSPAAWPGLNPGQGYDWGPSASSLSAVAGLMMIDELKAGHIDHAIEVALPHPCLGKWVYPAQRTDNWSVLSTDPNCIPEGAHLRLDPSVDLSGANLPPIGRMMVDAMKKYGIIVHDTTNWSVTFYAEQPTDGSDPYNVNGPLMGGQQFYDWLPKIPWNRLQLLQMGPICIPTNVSPCEH
jgi:hypothetical protein